MKKILAIILTLALVFSMSVTALAKEVEVDETASTYGLGTLIDSFTLNAPAGEQYTVTKYYDSHNSYSFRYTVLGVDGVMFNLNQVVPDGTMTAVARSQVAKTNDVFTVTGRNGKGFYTFMLENFQGNKTGLVIHVQVYGN